MPDVKHPWFPGQTMSVGTRPVDVVRQIKEALRSKQTQRSPFCVEFCSCIDVKPEDERETK